MSGSDAGDAIEDLTGKEGDTDTHTLTPLATQEAGHNPSLSKKWLRQGGNAKDESKKERGERRARRQSASELQEGEAKASQTPSPAMKPSVATVKAKSTARTSKKKQVATGQASMADLFKVAPAKGKATSASNSNTDSNKGANKGTTPTTQRGRRGASHSPTSTKTAAGAHDPNKDSSKGASKGSATSAQRSRRGASLSPSANNRGRSRSRSDPPQRDSSDVSEQVSEGETLNDQLND
jgi:hypothetical protein